MIKLAPLTCTSSYHCRCKHFPSILFSRCPVFSPLTFKMRAFARAVQRQRFNARDSPFHQSRQQRGFASVHVQDVKGLTVIDHHYE